MKSSVIVMLVEGVTDLCIPESLAECLTPQVQGVPADGDITVSHINVNGVRWPSGKNLAGTIASIIRRYVARTHDFELRDIIAVAQLADLDGVYIPDDRIVEGNDLLYLTDRIEAGDRQAIIDRNQEKRRRLDILNSWETIRLGRTRSVPYRIFYNSRNLEHAMHGERETLSTSQKNALSLRLTAQTVRDPQSFRRLVTSEPVLHGLTDYTASWQWVRQDANSLMRGSNIGLLPQEFQLDWLV